MSVWLQYIHIFQSEAQIVQLIVNVDNANGT